MPVFDIHIHVQPWEMLKPEVMQMMDDPSHAGVKEILSSPERLLAYLDREEVERACCINYVSPDVMGFTRETNDWIAAFTRNHRDRLLPVGSVNPLYEQSPADELARILDLGIRLIKIHPPHQLFAANAYRFDLPRLAEVYRGCEERNVPVMFHTGTSIFPRARNVYADPMAIDDVAVDFPRLKVILAHAGRPLYGDTAFFLARRHGNVMVEVSGIPPKSLLTAFPRLPEIADKVLWGTDWPSPGVRSMKANVQAFRELGYPEDVQRKVLYDNAALLFA